MDRLRPGTDALGRTIDCLRVSVTDRCNERCLYCMPENYKGWTQREDHLTAEEIVACVETATRLGFRKFRITGGEPLLRRDIVAILERIGRLPGVDALGLSTNGTRLAPLATALRQAGVHSLNVSLDALSPETYRQITGGRVDDVLEGLRAARAARFEMLKLNCVLLRGINEDEYFPLIQFSAARRMPLRFIELMPVTTPGGTGHENFLPVPELMRRLSTLGTLTPCEDLRLGHGPARYYQYASPRLEHPAWLGFIGALTTAHFCANCNKLRLTADGRLRPCLGRHGEIDIRSTLRTGRDMDAAFRDAIANKPEGHEFLDAYQPERPMTAIGG